MSTTDTATTHEPVDAVVERLNDPAVAAALVTLLDNVELLSTLVLGLSGFLERGDTIMDSDAAGVTELKAVTLTNDSDHAWPSPSEVAALTSALARSTPVITEVLDSSMVSAETVALLAMISESAAEGATRARETSTSISGLRAVLKVLKDPEVGRGLGLLVETAKALGRRMGASAS